MKRRARTLRSAQAAVPGIRSRAVPLRAAAALAALLIAGCSAAGGHQAARGPYFPEPADSQMPAIPAHGAYFGARVNPYNSSPAGQVAALDQLQQELGRRLAIVHTYQTWEEPFPSPTDIAALRQNSMLLLSWTGTYSRPVANGTYDRQIRQEAREIKALGKPVFLEWRWEMNRPNLAAVVGSPAEFIAAWKHVHAIFAQEHVRNVAWVWCPTSKGFEAGGNAPLYYPGDSEVDWVCEDAYPGPGPYRSFADTVRPFLAWASHHRKPVMIGEYGAPQRYDPQQRAQWLTDAARTVRDNPQIKAMVYFDVNPLGASANGFSLDPGTSPLRAFRAIARSQYFNPVALTARTQP